MHIGELAKAVGVNTKTVRYYEAVGLLPEASRSPAGYRQYDQHDVERLAFIRQARELDMGLDEISEILALREQGQRPCGYVLEVAARRITELDERIDRMRRTRDELDALLSTAKVLPDDDRCYCQLIEHRAEH